MGLEWPKGRCALENYFGLDKKPKKRTKVQPRVQRAIWEVQETINNKPNSSRPHARARQMQFRMDHNTSQSKSPQFKLSPSSCDFRPLPPPCRQSPPTVAEAQLPSSIPQSDHLSLLYQVPNLIQSKSALEIRIKTNKRRTLRFKVTKLKVTTQ